MKQYIQPLMILTKLDESDVLTASNLTYSKTGDGIGADFSDFIVGI